MSEQEEPQAFIDPMIAIRRRRSRSRSLKRSFGKWSRACWPFLFVAGAALLSAGVVRVVETAPPAVTRADLAPPNTPVFRPVENLLDLEFFDQHFYWDQSRIKQAGKDQISEITLSRDSRPVSDLVAGDSFLDDPVGVPIDPSELPHSVDAPGFATAGARVLPSVDGAADTGVLHPVAAWPLGIALCLVATRAAVASTRKPREAPRQS